MSFTDTIARRAASLPRLTFRSLLDRLVAADQAYRDRHHLRELPEHLLRDMGMPQDSTGRTLFR